MEPTGPFTRKWTLKALSFEPVSGHSRVIVNLNDSGRLVKAVIDASDFRGLIRGDHDPARNSTRYSDLAYSVSILLMGQILLLDPSWIQADEVGIGSLR
jgi:hypothetical protein